MYIREPMAPHSACSEGYSKKPFSNDCTLNECVSVKCWQLLINPNTIKYIIMIIFRGRFPSPFFGFISSSDFSVNGSVLRFIYARLWWLRDDHGILFYDLWRKSTKFIWISFPYAAGFCLVQKLPGNADCMNDTTIIGTQDIVFGEIDSILSHFLLFDDISPLLSDYFFTLVM